MVLKVNGVITQARPHVAWRIWSGPISLAALFVFGNVYGFSHSWQVSALQVAFAETFGIVAVALPFLRLVRDVNIGPYGIEAHFYRGSTRYVRWYEIDSVTVHPHAFIPSRVRLEDVFGHKIYLKGERSSLDPLVRVVHHHLSER
jgi:hypothetical protein